MAMKDSWGNSPASGSTEKDLWGSSRAGRSVNVLSHWEQARTDGKGLSGFYSVFRNNWKSSMSCEQLCILKRIHQSCITISAGTGCTSFVSKEWEARVSAGAPGSRAGVWAQR